MEIIGAIIGIFIALVNPTESSASNAPYEFVREYRTAQECQIAIADTDDICTTEPDLYLGTRQYSRSSGNGEVYSDNVCNRITGCAVDQSAKTEEEYCPTCSQSIWYLMND